MAEFTIKVQELEDGGKHYDFPVRRAWLTEILGADRSARDLAVRPDDGSDGMLSIIAEKSGEDVVVRGTLRAKLLAECSRCLADAVVPVDVEVGALFSHRAADRRPVAVDSELDLDAADHESYTGEHVVLDELVREHIWLEVPMQPLCKESCEGLPIPESIRGPADLSHEAASLGASGTKPIDPRLAPLLEILETGKTKPRSTSSTSKSKKKSSKGPH
jgi:uncharacterized protein